MTAAKREANRRNALRSTGPRTPDGKSRSRWNGLRHGLTAELVVLPDEDGEAFEALRHDLREELAPVGALEALLVDRIAALAWRLRRLVRVEKELYGEDEPWPARGASPGLAFRRLTSGNAFDRLNRYERTLDGALSRALHELERHQAARQGAPVWAPAVLDVTLADAPVGSLRREEPAGSFSEDARSGLREGARAR